VFPPHRSGRVRSAKTPVTKTCLQCGAVLPSSVRACKFCDTSSIADTSSYGSTSATTSPQIYVALNAERSGVASKAERAGERMDSPNDLAWRGELANRLEAYRVRRRKLTPNAAQSQLPFADPVSETLRPAVAVAEAPLVGDEDFSFTIAIGRLAKNKNDDEHMMIDVSLPAASDPSSSGPPQADIAAPRLYGVAPLEDRRLAGLIDMACLFFAYGGFLALFGSLGGQFTVSKLSAVMCVATFAVVYFQYFALFTVFGGTTPGMMLRGLEVASFSGEAPTPRQMLWRSGGYLVSAGTFFLGFLWAMWDEDGLTWHDRVSHTYLSPAQTYADIEAQSVSQGR
jgi:uncharacterized RDD family membrane protein YckC